MKERIDIIKNLFPDYLIVIKAKDKIKFMGIDKKIVDNFGYLNLKNVNKLILDNLAILKKEEYDNNLYKEYYLKTRLIDIIKEIKEELV